MRQDIIDLLTRLSGDTHRAGEFGSEILKEIARHIPEGPIRSLETGCGKSTVMFSNISAEHLVFAYDDRDLDGSSVGMVEASPHFVPTTTRFVFGPTQKTLPRYDFGEDEKFDVILIDGPHGYPFPDLEYALLYDKLKAGSLLIIDDIHIPSIGHMFDILRADRMYDEVAVVASTAILRRTSVSGVPSTGDHWYEQNYNVSQFPRSMGKYNIDRLVPANGLVEFNSEEVVRQFGVRGIELSPDGQSASTIDIGATLEFRMRAPAQKVFVGLTYRSHYADSSELATISDGRQSFKLPYHPSFTEERFVFEFPSDGRLRLTILHANAKPEHDRGNKRYEFRRLGAAVRAISFDKTQATSKPEKRGRLLRRVAGLLRS